MCGISVTLVGNPPAQNPLARFGPKVMQQIYRFAVHSQRKPRLSVRWTCCAIVLTVEARFVLFEIEVERNHPSARLAARYAGGASSRFLMKLLKALHGVQCQSCSRIRGVLGLEKKEIHR